jgi:hypothetical protein
VPEQVNEEADEVALEEFERDIQAAATSAAQN